jgi:tetratricopeptide (TPR) repeat protein
MNRIPGLILAVVVGGMLLPVTAEAQRGSARPSNDMWTRSAALYLDRARNNPRPDEKRELWQQALEAALEGTQNNPGNPRTWYLAGEASLWLGDYVRADSLFDRAQELFPEYPEIERERMNAWIRAYNAGVTAMQQGNHDEAIEHMQRADVIYDKRPGARLTLGSLYARKGETDAAVAAYTGALEILRGPARAALQGRAAREWGEQEEIAAFNMAQILAGAERYDEAIRAYHEYLVREPESLLAKQNLAVVLTRKGDREQAAEIYAELLQRTDLNDRDYFQVGIGLFQAERHPQAVEAFRKALALNPASRDALYNLAQALYIQANKLEEGRTSVAADPARDAELTGFYNQILETVERLREIDPANRNVLAIAARAYRGLADIAPDDRVGDQHRAKALEMLTAHRDMKFEVWELAVLQEAEKAMLRGRLLNHDLAPGTPVTLNVMLLAPNGTTVATQAITVTMPEKDAQASFVQEVAVEEPIGGWKYTVSR